MNDIGKVSSNVRNCKNEGTAMANTGKREDRRTRYTRQVIQEAFFELLREKDFERISVADLCRRADINRGTFYLHYVDKYDLLDQIIDEMLDEELPEEEQALTMCQRVPVREDYRLLYLSEQTLPHVQRHIIDRAGSTMIPAIMERSGVDEETARLVFVYGVSGNLAVNSQLRWRRSEHFNDMQAIFRTFYDGGIDSIGSRSKRAR